jgi:hypothetical protein
MVLSNMIKEINELEVKKQTLLNELKNKINSLPENNNIKVLSDSPRCFVIMADQLIKHDNWSPQFHSFKHQYEQVSEWIEKQDLIDIPKNWNESKKKGFLGKFGTENIYGKEIIRRDNYYSERVTNEVVETKEVFRRCKGYTNLHPDVIMFVDELLNN